MRFLFCSAQLAAHLDWGGYLPTAAELARRGHEALWTSGQNVASTVERAGVRFAALSETGWRWPPPPPLARSAGQSEAEYQHLRAERSLDQWLDVERVIASATEIEPVARAFSPDLIVSEMFVAAAGICAERLEVPFVVAGWPAHAPAATSPSADVYSARRRLDSILVHTQAKGVNFTRLGPPTLQSPRLHVTYWSPGWFSGATLLPQTAHVGGIAPAPLAPDPSLPHPDNAPWVFITLGTTFHDDNAFFRICAEAVLELGGTPVIAAGPLDNGALARLAQQLPAGVFLRTRVNFAATLPYCAAAIHHGGAGTTHALVTHAVPQLVVPHAGDQARQALGVQRSGAGLALRPADVTPLTVGHALDQLLPDRSPLRARALALRTEFAALGGIPRGADLLEGAASH